MNSNNAPLTPFQATYEEYSFELYANEDYSAIGTSQRAVANIVGCSPASVNSHMQGVQETDKIWAQVQTQGGIQGVQLVPPHEIFRLALRFNLPLAEAMGSAGAHVFLLGLAGLQVRPVVPVASAPTQLPYHKEALEVSECIVGIHDNLGNLDPRLAQILIDRAMQTVMPVALPGAPEPSLAGAVEIATGLGFRVGREQSSLGKAVAKAWREATGTEPQKAKRECGGAMRNISVYPINDPAVVVAIKTFYGRVLG
jgi:hypothetical protein